MRRSPVISLLFVGLSSCYSIDDKKPASPLEAMNGEKYSSALPVTVQGLPLPLVTRISQAITVTGKVVAGGKDAYYLRPLKSKKARLVRDGKQFVATTDDQGAFKFVDDKLDGAWTLSIDGCPETRDVQISGFEVNLGEWQIACIKP